MSGEVVHANRYPNSLTVRHRNVEGADDVALILAMLSIGVSSAAKGSTTAFCVRNRSDRDDSAIPSETLLHQRGRSAEVLRGTFVSSLAEQFASNERNVSQGHIPHW